MCQKRRNAVQQTPPLFNYLVSACEQRRWDGEAEHLGGREIDGKIKFGRLLNRDIAGLRPVQNLVDQLGSAPELIRVVWSVGHETPGLDIIAGIEDRRQPRTERAGFVRFSPVATDLSARR